MNGSQIHLALTHVPVILSIVALVVMVVAAIRKNDTLYKTSFYILFIAGISSVPVFITGESAEEIVERMPGVSESVIERHEDLASFAFGMAIATGIISMAALVLYARAKVLRFIRPLLLFLSLVTGVVMAVTAHFGGQVRHTEIRSGFTAPSENGANNDLQKQSDD